jgi:hypothetical protein
VCCAPFQHEREGVAVDEHEQPVAGALDDTVVFTVTVTFADVRWLAVGILVPGHALLTTSGYQRLRVTAGRTGSSNRLYGRERGPNRARGYHGK